MKIILVGKAASGKDFLKHRLHKKGFTIGVSHTTRLPRNSEIDGEDYHLRISCDCIWKPPAGIRGSSCSRTEEHDIVSRIFVIVWEIDN